MYESAASCNVERVQSVVASVTRVMLASKGERLARSRTIVVEYWFCREANKGEIEMLNLLHTLPLHLL